MPARFQVREQRGDRLIALAGVVAMAGRCPGDRPTAGRCRSRPAPRARPRSTSRRGDQAAPGEWSLAVEVACRGRFAAEVEGLAGLELHAEGLLQRGDPGLQGLVARPRLQVLAVQRLEQVELLALGLRR